MEAETRYFVAKLANMNCLKTSLKSCVWACNDRKYPPQPKDVLSQAFKDGKVVLLFSVNNCHGWHGCATMKSVPGSVDEHGMEHKDRSIALSTDTAEDISSTACQYEPSDGNECVQTAPGNKVQEQCAPPKDQPQWHRFKIQWQILFLWEHGEQCLPFTSTQEMSTSDGEPINKARNLQEVSFTTGEKLCHLMKDYYEELSKRKMKKAEEQMQNQPEPFFHPEPIVLNDSCAVWARLVDKVNDIGKVLLACAFGSQRYNLHTPESDTDMFVIYVADTKDILGFNQPQQTIKNHEAQCCDYTIHEVHRYCELLLSGDPRSVETLFLHPSAIYQSSEEWQQLCKHGKDFLTRQCVEKYLRDALGAKGLRLLEKWVKSGEALREPMPAKVSKLFYIILRLLQNAEDAAEGQTLKVYRQEETAEHQLLMAARSGQYTYEQLRQEMEKLQQSVENTLSLRNRSKEEEEACIKSLLETWLLQMRYNNFKEFMDTRRQTTS